jgi:hypothetical protein
VVSGVPKAVLSKRIVAGTTRRVDGALALSSRPAIEGRRSDIVCCAPVEFVVKCCRGSMLRSLKLRRLVSSLASAERAFGKG